MWVFILFWFSLLPLTVGFVEIFLHTVAVNVTLGSFGCPNSGVLLISRHKGIFVSHLLLTTQDKTDGIPKIRPDLVLPDDSTM